MDEVALNIFTDGSSYSKPRAGGAGVRFVFVDQSGKEIIEDFPSIGYSGVTNNQMELQACIDALKQALKHNDISQFSRIIIYTDSSYVVDNYKTAIHVWSNSWNKNKWQTRHGTPVLNAELWKELLKYSRKIYQKFQKGVEIEWIKGHSKNEHNKAADKLAKQAAKASSRRKISIVKVRRKKFEEVDGAPEMLGQRMSIYIITDERLKVQRIFKYKYQVVSRKSPYFKMIGLVYSEEMLQAGHSYSVRFNFNNKNPRIAKVFRELTK